MKTSKNINDSNNLNIKFKPMKEEEITKYLENIKNFGKIDKFSGGIFE